MIRIWIVVLLLVVTCGCNAQNAATANSNSHVEGNAPKGALFDEYLTRDLNSYFCKGLSECRVDFEYLRQGPTQSGVSYPKYYLWAKCYTKDKLKTEGAVRVAAVNQQRFEITDYLSSEQIVSSPDSVAGVFPSALIDKIIQKAKH